jgi:uncharacterized phage protein gp47/JayE
MPSSFASIRAKAARTAVRSFILATLDAVGFQATSWQPGSVPFVLLEAAATVCTDLYIFAADVAGGGYGETARGQWADDWADDRYAETRTKERFATGVMVAAGNGNSHSPTAGAFVVELNPPDGRTWVSTAGVTIPAVGSVNVPMRGSQAGARFNIPSGATLRVVSGFAGVTVTNPPQPGSQTWLSIAGADTESDRAFTGRCPQKWSTLSIAIPKGYYPARIRQLIPTITKAVVLDDNPLGPGSAELIVATGAGPASAGDVTAANAALAIIRSVGAGKLQARAAVAETMLVEGTAYVAAAHLSTARAAVTQELATLQTDLEIGGRIYAAEIIRIVKSQTGVRNFVPSSGLVDLTPAPDAVATIVDLISWVAE